jgi:hypothetical protein
LAFPSRPFGPVASVLLAPLALLALLGLALLAACTGQTRRSGFDPGPGGTLGSGGGKFGGGGTGSCVPNPQHYDIPDNGCDDDGDGTIDNPEACDDRLAESGTAEDFARSMGICTRASEAGYGLVSAAFTRGYGKSNAPENAQHGVLPRFGRVVRPQEGSRLGVLSTGYAQEFNGAPDEPFGGKNNGKDWTAARSFLGLADPGALPPGFPKPARGCPIESTVYDVISLKLELKAPRNASGIRFDFNFYSGEWPAFICTNFNDGFIAYLTARGFKGGVGDNISFDGNDNPVSVNNGFFDRCTAGVRTGCLGANQATSTCPAGTEELMGTGFGIEGEWCPGETSVAGGSTGWLTSQAPVEPGETFTLELMIWDTGDGVMDSSVLVDRFTWVEGDVVTITDRPR